MKVKYRTFLRITIPLLAVLGGVYSILYFYVLPSLYHEYMQNRFQQTRDLTYSACHMLQMFHDREAQGLSRQEAKAQAVAFFKAWRYGADKKSYFWISDLRYQGIVNPYRPDLEGRNLSNLTDPEGNRFIVLFAEIARQKGEGFAFYTWQRNDDPEHSGQKYAFVKLFGPWEWVIGTGVYEEDIRAEFSRMRTWLAVSALLIVCVLLTLCFIVLWKNVSDEERRQLAERALAETRMNFQDLVESVNIIILCLDKNGCITFINEYAQNFFGFSRKEIEGRSVVGTIVPETDTNGQNLRTMMEDIVARPEHYAINENENTCRDGRRVWIAWGNKPILDETGALRGVYSVGRDITALKHIEEKLRSSEDRHRQLFQIADTMVITLGTDGKILDFDEIAETLTGYRREEVIGQYVFELFLAPDERAWYHSTLPDLAAGKPLCGIEKEIFIKGGYRRWVELFATVKESDENMPRQILLSARDITKAHVAKEGQRISQQRMHDILAHAPVFLLSYSLDGRLLYATDNIQSICHVSRIGLEESRDMLLMHLHPDDRERIQALWNKAWTQAVGWGESFRLQIDGKERWLSLHISVTHNPQGTPICLTGVGMDISEHHRQRLAEAPASPPATSPQPEARKIEETPKPKAPTASREIPLAEREMRILLVDDEVLICQAMSDMLHILGYKVHVCHDGAAGVSYYSQHAKEIDLVIMDMIMPKLNGDEACQKIRQINPTVRILIMSGYAEDDPLLSVEKLGVDGILVKPVRTAQLAQTVARILGTGTTKD